jgi:hypothetical protein
MPALPFLLLLLAMWGVVVTIYAVLFFPEIVKALRHKDATAQGSSVYPAHELKHWGRHASHTT